MIFLKYGTSFLPVFNYCDTKKIFGKVEKEMQFS